MVDSLSFSRGPLRLSLILVLSGVVWIGLDWAGLLQLDGECRYKIEREPVDVHLEHTLFLLSLSLRPYLYPSLLNIKMKANPLLALGRSRTEFMFTAQFYPHVMSYVT